MIVPLLCGSAIGVSCWLAIRALRARPVELASALSDLGRPRVGLTTAGDEYPSTSRARRICARAAESGGFVTDRLRSDLRIADRSLEKHAFDKVLLAVYGVSLPIVVGIALATVDIDVAPTVLAVASVGLGLGGFLVPELTLRHDVEARQRDFTFALGAYLELVTVILAGGGGVETALTEAAEAGDGRAFAELRRALASCRLTGGTPWDAFASLGHELGLPALNELAASVSLAGEQGAKVRASLGAKAASLRDHEMARAEAEAQSATERMALPLVMLLFGFVLFIGYPAVVRVLTSL